MLPNLILVTMCANPEWRKAHLIVGGLWLLGLIASLGSNSELAPALGNASRARRSMAGLAAGSGERLPAAFDQCLGRVVCGRAAPADAIGVEVRPGRIAVAEGIADLLAVAREPGLELAAVHGDSGRGDAMLFGIGETGRQCCQHGFGAADGRWRGSLWRAGAARDAQQQTTHADSDPCGHGPS